MGLDITSAFEVLKTAFTQIIFWMQNHGFFFMGTFYSFFNIEIAALVLAEILVHLPVWGDTKFVKEDDNE